MKAEHRQVKGHIMSNHRPSMLRHNLCHLDRGGERNRPIAKGISGDNGFWEGFIMADGFSLYVKE